MYLRCSMFEKIVFKLNILWDIHAKKFLYGSSRPGEDVFLGITYYDINILTNVFFLNHYHWGMTPEEKNNIINIFTFETQLKVISKFYPIADKPPGQMVVTISGERTSW